MSLYSPDCVDPGGKTEVQGSPTECWVAGLCPASFSVEVIGAGTIEAMSREKGAEYDKPLNGLPPDCSDPSIRDFDWRTAEISWNTNSSSEVENAMV